MDDFAFHLTGGEGTRRAFRAHVNGLAVLLRECDCKYSVKDISATGFALIADTVPFQLGQELRADVLVGPHAYLADVACRIVRQGEGLVAFDFLSLDREQEARLDKLVLEIQKHAISKRQTEAEED